MVLTRWFVTKNAPMHLYVDSHPTSPYALSVFVALHENPTP